MSRRIRIGTAGWTIPRAVRERFPEEGTGLERYAARFDACEINSTFYRPHKPQTYAGWVARTPPGFQLSVKAPRRLTHEAKLADPAPLAGFVEEVRALGERLGPLLVQLPPSLALDEPAANAFFAELRRMWDAPAACEPRHASWFTPEADALLVRHRIARAAADPVRHPGAGAPGGWLGFAYWRLHGSPRVYFSPYDEPALDTLAEALLAHPAEEAWCIFDNTASGAAAADALRLAARLPQR